MKKIAIFLIVMLTAGCNSSNYPDVIRIEGGKLHVQGIALDKEKDCMYSSFTSAFFKTDLSGRITASITGINGHLGAMTFDPEGRKVYASLEIKDDEIGKGIARTLGAEEHSRSGSCFYVAEIDVDKVTGPDTPFEEAVTLHEVEDAGRDYLAMVEVDGKMLEHRYGCSGIDGITIGPAFGSGKRNADHLYVAYGIYGDTTRVDNDYNIILCYRLKDLTQPVHKYFVRTGNTTFGVQNMAYDSHSDRLYLAVYKGSKRQYPNYRMFVLDMAQQPFEAMLENAPYETGTVEQLKVQEGWHFKWGSTGLCPIGNGRWFISENSKTDECQICDARQYILTGNADSPFIPAAEDNVSTDTAIRKIR